ncbi:Trypsin-like cysteine/serine peptidase domain containing protein [Naviculisporaceae sp. PSN 640]
MLMNNIKTVTTCLSFPSPSTSNRFYHRKKGEITYAMATSPRKTRAQKQAQQNHQEQHEQAELSAPPGQTPQRPQTTLHPVYYKILDLANYSPQPISIPSRPSKAITKLSPADQKLLLHKQSLLLELIPELPIPKSFQKHAALVGNTLVFAREEAGTAVVIREDGLLLTCAHCVAETTKEFEDENVKEKVFWLILASGRIVSATCIAWDPRRDLALLGILSASGIGLGADGSVASGTTSGPRKGNVADGDKSGEPTNLQLQVASLAECSPPPGTALVCIGHPGSEDLETARRGVKTNYDVLHVSIGSFRGIADGQDVQDNEDIGALMHDCWTYWGHSGAPLLDRKTGKLVGLHSSWDDQTGMRRGVAVEAIKEFLQACAIGFDQTIERV